MSFFARVCQHVSLKMDLLSKAFATICTGESFFNGVRRHVRSWSAVLTETFTTIRTAERLITRVDSDVLETSLHSIHIDVLSSLFVVLQKIQTHVHPLVRCCCCYIFFSFQALYKDKRNKRDWEIRWLEKSGLEVKKCRFWTYFEKILSLGWPDLTMG